MIEPQQEPVKGTDTSEDLRLVGSTFIRQSDHGEAMRPIPGLLEGRVTLIAAAGGVGKTTMCEQIGRHLCSGSQLGHFPLPAQSIIGWALFLEDEEVLTQDRSHRANRLGTLREDSAPIGENDNFFYGYGRDWTIPKLKQRLEDAREHGELPGIIFIDHLRLLIGPQPAGTSPNDWERRNLLRLIDVAMEFNCHIVVLTHLNKSGAISGTTDLVSTADSSFIIEPNPEDRRMATLACHKLRYSEMTDYAMSKNPLGIWQFDPELAVSDTKARGIALEILRVLEEGPMSLAELVADPRIGGGRAGIRYALDQSRKKGWVRPYRGMWEKCQPEIPAQAAPVFTTCKECNGLIDPDGDDGSGYHAGCDPNVSLAAIVREVVPEDPEDDETEEDSSELAAQAWKSGRLQLQMGLDRLNSGNYHPIPVIAKSDRDSGPWPLMNERTMTGAHKWELAQLPEGGYVTVLDRNGSFPSCLSSVPIAPNKLTHTGPLKKEELHGRAGIFQVEMPQWSNPAIGHPLGHRVTEGETMWVTTNQLKLLQRLAADYQLEEVAVLDSWTGKANTTFFKEMYDWCKQGRKNPDEEWRGLVKVSSSKWLRLLWPKQAKSPFWRPDWRLAVVNEHAVRHWANAWKAVQSGAVCIFIGNTDEVAFWTPEEPAEGWVPEGYTLGTDFGQVKIKAVQTMQEWKESRRGNRNR